MSKNLIVSNDLSSSGQYVMDNNSNQSKLSLTKNGNIGIGTTQPKGALHNTGDYYGRGHLFLYAYDGDGNSGTAYIQARDDSGNSNIGLQFRTQSNGKNNDAVIITPTGNVGIGKEDPGAKLNVEGDLFIKGEKPFTINRFTGIGSGAINFDTKKSYDKYMAAIVGFSSRGGDIEEWGKSWNLISIYMNPSDTTRTWFINADFRTSENETWDFVDVMFIRRELCGQNA